MTLQSAHPVALIRCGGYQPPLLAEALQSLLAHLELPASLPGMTVLLKPNLISSRGPSLACTHPRLIAAVARWFIDQGARVKIGDSPAFGTTSSVMARHGMTDLLAGLPVEQVQFRTPVRRTLAGGLTVEIAAEALECDLLVNLPKLKAHNQMYMTAAVKNFFGVVVGIRKAMLHMRCGNSHREFAEMVLALPDLLGPHLSIVDGIEPMHRSGPLDGEPLDLRCLAGSRCPVTLDTALMQLLELAPEKSPLWQVAADGGHPGSRAGGIHYPLAGPREFRGSGFVAPGDLHPIRFSPLRLLVGAMRRLGLAIRG